MASPTPPPPKMYLNEHLSPTLAATLRQSGFDGVSSLEVGMEEKPDHEHLAYALNEQRAILTFNVRHFAPLHHKYLSGGKEHWGIVCSTEEPFRTLFGRLMRLFHSLTATELKNQLRWLNEFK